MKRNLFVISVGMKKGAFAPILSINALSGYYKHSETLNHAREGQFFAAINKLVHLVTGPTGAGKELIARAIAREAEGAPFYPVNSSCFGKDLMESELFGHERGSFSGAEKTKPGIFELAHNGDIFLDEIATLSLSHQAKLLRILQSGEYFRVGGIKLLKTNARVIAATNEDLEAMVKQGTVREDLLQRLKRFHISLPALAERREDIPVIIESLLKKSSKPQLSISSECMEILTAYDWPRNIRELEDCINAMVLNSEGDTLTVGDLPRKFFVGRSPHIKVSDENKLAIEIDTNSGLDHAQSNLAKKFILHVASMIEGPLTSYKLSKALSIPRTTLRRKLEELNLNIPQLAADAKVEGVQ